MDEERAQHGRGLRENGGGAVHPLRGGAPASITSAAGGVKQLAVITPVIRIEVFPFRTKQRYNNKLMRNPASGGYVNLIGLNLTI